MDYSPFVLDIESEKGTNLLSTCRELGIAIVAAMPLGRGMVTADFAAAASDNDTAAAKATGGDKRAATMPRFSDDNRPTNAEVIRQFKAMADKHGCTVSQLALAWLLKQGDDIIPIPGTKRIAYLEQNWEARNVKLTDEDEAEVRKFLEAAELAGGTLPPAFESYNYRDTVEES